MDTVAIKTAPPHAPLSSTVQQKQLKHNTNNNSASNTSNTTTSSTDCLKYSKSGIGAFFQTCKVSFKSIIYFFFLIYKRFLIYLGINTYRHKLSRKFFFKSLKLCK